MKAIQINITGFNALPSSLLCAYDDDLDFLIISKESENFNENRIKNDYIFITNSPRTEERDFLFTTDYFNDAISAYYQRKNNKTNDNKSRLHITEKALRANPENVIENDGFDDKGKPKYRIQENITNIQVATLVACYFAEKFQLNNNVVDYANDCDNAELFAIHTI